MSPNGSDRSPRRFMRRKLPQALALGLVIATATGCSSEDLPRLGLPAPATEQAPRVLSLWQGSWAAALVVGAVVWGLVIWSVIFHRRSRHKQEIPVQTRYNMPIEALYTVVPLMVISVLFYFTARDESELLKTSDQPDHTIEVVGYQWSWGFNYQEQVDGVDGVWDTDTPGGKPVLYLPEGESVRFVLNSRDVIHSFWVPNFLFKMDVIPGVTNEFEVTPNRVGEFEGKCAELCGTDHSRMLFEVHVVTPDEYQAKLQELKDAGQTGALPATIPAMADENSGSEQ
ncbi:aa3-type cytochrome oxidase subunit II [Allostreptomyces psammosilenae]|uniref:Probable cytochrome c oxidase subunit 2 n=1 Tax=Allostreptomyces psammosilenae TaxID=1892865 RepID=A0A853A8Q8_9ACTN|nr:cytochrome c oxidase subunit II [Allostreptomyces psammosilenae]NYI07021.1 cytochrome c oxidase subunit 2 [Allostreptomyces psammosilenae]